MGYTLPGLKCVWENDGTVLREGGEIVKGRRLPLFANEPVSISDFSQSREGYNTSKTSDK